MKKIILMMLICLPIFAHAEIKSDLKTGSKGSEVIELQNFLINKGFLNGEASGNYFSLTRKAVISFQLANGIRGTGLVGPMTRNKINNEAGKSVVVSTNSNLNSNLTSVSNNISTTTQENLNIQARILEFQNRVNSNFLVNTQNNLNQNIQANQINSTPQSVNLPTQSLILTSGSIETVKIFPLSQRVKIGSFTLKTQAGEDILLTNLKVELKGNLDKQYIKKIEISGAIDGAIMKPESINNFNLYQKFTANNIMFFDVYAYIDAPLDMETKNMQIETSFTYRGLNDSNFRNSNIVSSKELKVNLVKLLESDISMVYENIDKNIKAGTEFKIATIRIMSKEDEININYLDFSMPLDSNLGYYLIRNKGFSANIYPNSNKFTLYHSSLLPKQPNGPLLIEIYAKTNEIGENLQGVENTNMSITLSKLTYVQENYINEINLNLKSDIFKLVK